MDARALILLLLLGPAQAPVPRPAVSRATTHYDLRVEGTAQEAATFEKVLEAAWPVFREFFHVEPPLDKGERLAVRVFDTREACVRGMMDDKVEVPPAKQPAWFSPGNGTVYLYRDGTAWFARYLLIYGACLQFHGLAKPKHRDLDEWYTHGIAESFAVHSFDGEHLELATSPPISCIDHPARALLALGGRRIGLDPFSEAKLADPAVRWALVRFATSGAEGKHRARFEKLALGATGSRLSGYDFMRSLGAEPRITQEFSAWLLSAQMPLESVQPEWEAFADGRIVARSAPDEQALCATKAGLTKLEVGIDAAPELDAGVPGILFGFEDEGNYFLAKLLPPSVYFVDVRNGKQHGIDSRPIERPGSRTLVSVARRGRAVELEINGKTYDPFDFGEGPEGRQNGRLGLAAIGGQVTFRDVKCR